jgi:peptidyl-prolyl cis-trans isomerase C
VVTVIIIGAIGICLGCAKQEESEGLAKVGDKIITNADLEERLRGMPPYMKQQLSTPEGRKRFIQGLVEEEVIVREALARGLDRTDDFRREMELRKRDTLVRQFYSDVIEAEAAPPESLVVAYYEAHRVDYAVPENLQARHILVESKEQAENLRERLLAGEDFGELAEEHSLDQQTKGRDGMLHGSIERGAVVRGLGKLPEFVEGCFQIEEGELSQPIRTELGYHIVRVDKKNPETVKPLDEVRQEIEGLLRNTRVNEVRDRMLNDLKVKYKVVYLTEAQSGPKTPEDLFKLASEETNPQEKIKHYEEFIETYPDNERAYEAKFMIGFTLAEDLENFEEAEQVFNQFLEQYPESDLSDDAKWMIENMRSGTQPEFDS